MPISGLLITLDREPSRRSRALAALRRHHRIEVGEGEEHRVPIVIDTPTSDEDRAVWDWLHEQPGVTFVDVVYVHFDGEEEGSRDRVKKGSSRTESAALRAKALDASIPRSRDPLPHHARGES